ncbi:MAG TPA: response regulator [Bryobacteraceae bacterium]|nr:response regulator [Bryobacteraceae bacterium]
MSPAILVQAQSDVPVLVISPDEGVHSSLARILKKDCCLHRAAGRRDGILYVRKLRPWVVVCDQNLADGDWRDLLRDLQAEEEMPPLIVSSRVADDRLWAEVLNLGGYDLLSTPFAATEVIRVVRMAAHHGKATVGG